MLALCRILSALVVLAACGVDEDVTGALTWSPTSGTSSTGDDPLSSTSLTSSTASPTSSDTLTSVGDTTSATVESGGSFSGTSASSSGLPPNCNNGLLDQDETDLDCGGSCQPCLDGQLCKLPSDCEFMACHQGLCGAECDEDADCAVLEGPCVSASCDLQSGTCEVLPKPNTTVCDDQNPCTPSSTCDQAVCVGESQVDCSQLDTLCGLGLCDPQTGKCGVSPGPDTEGKPCDDGYVCTFDDVCSAGVCGPGNPGYAFFEDFSAPAPGWMLGPTWEFGQAKLSPPGGVGGADPNLDHSPTDDQRLAGVVIGGLSQGPEGPKTCLTTPAVDTTTGKEVWLTFWRHLHTDFYPFVIHQIEVFDGVDWVEVELGYNNPGVDDLNWQQHYHDLSDYSNEALRVRFCYQRKVGADSFAGWSLDDLTLGASPCTPE